MGSGGVVWRWWGSVGGLGLDLGGGGGGGRRPGSREPHLVPSAQHPARQARTSLKRTSTSFIQIRFSTNRVVFFNKWWSDDRRWQWSPEGVRVLYAAMWAVVAAAFWVCVVATPQPLHLERDSFRRPNVWQKREQNPSSSSSSSASSNSNNPADMTQIPQLFAVNSQLMLRSPRGSRQYDVPQIGRFYSYQPWHLFFFLS